MNITIHIDRLVLDGLPVEARDGAVVQAAVQAELGRLLAEQGLPGDLRRGGNMVGLSAPSLPLNSTLEAKRLGTQIGAGIYASFDGLGHEKQSMEGGFTHRA